MNIYFYYLCFLKTQDETYLTKIIIAIRPYLFSIIKSLPDYEWDDALQEIEIEMFLQLQQRKFVVPNLDSFFTIFNKSLSQASSEEELLTLLDNKQFDEFLRHNTMVHDAFCAYQNGTFDLVQFRKNFICYYGSARIYRYIEKIARTRRSIVFKQLNNERHYINYHHDPMNMVAIEEKVTPEEQSKITITFEDLTKEEYSFIKSFIGRHRIYSQKFVGRVLGISQQAVSKRLRKIKVNVTMRCSQKHKDEE